MALKLYFGTLAPLFCCLLHLLTPILVSDLSLSYMFLPFKTFSWLLNFAAIGDILHWTVSIFGANPTISNTIDYWESCSVMFFIIMSNITSPYLHAVVVWRLPLCFISTRVFVNAYVFLVCVHFPPLTLGSLIGTLGWYKWLDCCLYEWVFIWHSLWKLNGPYSSELLTWH